MNSMSSSDNESLSNIVIIEEKIVVFDVDQTTNATQVLHLRRANGADIVAWRFQTNAPTRYLVFPNEGIFLNDQPVEVTIELVENRFNPLHKLRLQAISIIDKADWPKIWNEQSAQNAILTMWIELSTTVMNLASTSSLSEDESSSQLSLSRILHLSRSAGAERVKELKGLQRMLQKDRDTLVKNAEQIISLKEIITKQLRNRKKQSFELSKKLDRMELEYQSLQADVQRDEGELQNLRNNTSSHSTMCVIM